MMRGTFGNVRIQEPDASGEPDGSRTEGGITLHQPSGEHMPIYEAAMKYIAEGVPTVVFGGEEYGTDARGGRRPLSPPIARAAVPYSSPPNTTVGTPSAMYFIAAS